MRAAHLELVRALEAALLERARAPLSWLSEAKLAAPASQAFGAAQQAKGAVPVLDGRLWRGPSNASGSVSRNGEAALLRDLANDA